VVLCTGNALVHATGRDAMVQALTGLRRMARPGGHVVVDSRNWEKLHAERRIVQVADRVVTRGGRRCLALYAWEVPDRLGDEHIAHLVFVFDNGGQIEPHEHVVTFRPFTISPLPRAVNADEVRLASSQCVRLARRRCRWRRRSIRARGRPGRRARIGGGRRSRRLRRM